MAAKAIRVVVTGIGAISAAGPSAPDLWSALLDGRPCATPLERFDPGRPAVAAQVQAYPGPAGVPPQFARRLSRSAQFALDATIQAIADARITFNAQNAFQVAAVFGTAYATGEAGAPLFSSGLAGATTGLNIAGPAHTVGADGASGLIALMQAADSIRHGVVSVALAGGAEAPLTPAVWQAYATAGLLSSQATGGAQRPFDLLRDGLLLGEGAAALVLENRALAIQRGARIYAELLAGGQSAGPPGDGRPPTDVEIARRAISATLRRADRSPREFDVIFAAGTGTPAGDARETDVLERAFGAQILNTHVTTVTPVVGYTVGAAGALAAAAAALSLAEQVVPPHATYAEPDPVCGLDLVRLPQRDRLHGALVTAFGALGQNAALALAADSGS